MKKPFFEPIDFTLNGDPVDSIEITPFFAAKQANAKLEKEIQSWKVVYGVCEDKDTPLLPSLEWSFIKSPNDTHAAKLAFIEELPKKECEHEAKTMFVDGLGLVNLSEHTICKHCGVQLSASWSAK